MTPQPTGLAESPPAADALPLVAEPASVSVEAEPRNEPLPRMPWKSIFGVFSIVSVGLYGVLPRVYQEKYAITEGLDSSAPGFSKYWYTYLFVCVGVTVVGGGLGFMWLWKTRDRAMERLSPRDELRRYMVLAGIFLVGAGIGYHFAWIGEQDAAWHQVVIRDTTFTPSHIPLFYQILPGLIVAFGGALLYAMTRLPQFAGRVSIPFVAVVAGGVFGLVNVGFNEWAHTFWIAEEIFSAPVHWGFALSVWAIAPAGFATLLQVMPRVVELLQKDGQRATPAVAAA